MSRTLRKQAFTLIALLEKANRVLRTNLTMKSINKEGILQLLADCQDTAITLGNELETIYGDGTDSVAMLEEYCESLYQMTLEIEHRKQHRDILKKLTRQLRQIRQLVGKQISDKQEVVFLPYKASMWDSLESVWAAADKDENCEAYVVPIPYYERNPDGTFHKYHYEGEAFPEYVPVVHYENYEIEKRWPDIVFIHNPYDQYNYVTSVDPRFYSAKLKERTNRLVYIPYFVLGEILPDNPEQVKGVAHFCTLPGVLNADQVIVQSEDMRQVYINVLTEQFGEQTKSHWEATIWGTGSPKIDKVQNTRNELLNIPEEWMCIIRKTDGTRKKIILYNTSVTALLEQDMKMLQKMRSVFQAFQKNAEDIALLWRPHPLIEATISSMRPQLWAEYKTLLEEYRVGQWGIYDDSPELERAIALCDGYYGDPSSLVRLCTEVGKPIMIQDVTIR